MCEKPDCVACNEDAYEDYITQIYGKIKICGISFNSGYILRELDATAFRCGMCDEECNDEECESEE